jgi:hypothetical protein
LFPDVLLRMLADSEKQGFEKIISWAKGDGAAFKIHNIRYFEQLILPKYFKMTKYKSFTRQLHNYGFIWIRNGPNKGGCKLQNIYYVVLLLDTHGRYQELQHHISFSLTRLSCLFVLIYAVCSAPYLLLIILFRFQPGVPKARIPTEVDRQSSGGCDPSTNGW